MGAFWGLRDAAGARGAAAFCAASGTDRMQRPGALERSLARYLRSYRAKLQGPFETDLARHRSESGFKEPPRRVLGPARKGRRDA